MKKRHAWMGCLLLLCGSAVAAGKTGVTWVASWAASPIAMALPQPAADSTFENTIHLSLGGSAVRVTLTNEFGRTPLRINHVRLRAASTDATYRPLTFGGQSEVLIPAGGTATSDLVPMQTPALSDLTVRLYLTADQTVNPTCHESAIATNHIFHGDIADGAMPDNGQSYTSWCFLKDVQVQSDANASTIVALGDSITDGAHATVDANHRWPDYFAARLQGNAKTKGVAIVNQGIGGNRILYEGHGPSAASRVDRDVIAQPGVRYLVLLEGINDIDQTINPQNAEAQLTVEQMTSAVSQIVERAHAHHILVYGATLTPNAGIKTVTAHVNELRNAYNHWLRTSGVADGVIDFDLALRDPQKPNELLKEYDCGDHLHPSDAGYKAMADAIDLTLFDADKEPNHNKRSR
jgi:lysophospholipase L1-like esterase